MVTPAAGMQAVAGHGVLQVVADPRTTLTQALAAVLIAEPTYQDSWPIVLELAEGLGQDELAERCELALGQEQQHVAPVRRWASTALAGRAGIDPTPPLDRRRPPVI